MQRSTNTVALERLKQVVCQGATTRDGLPLDLTEALAVVSRAHKGRDRRGCRRVSVCLPIRYRSQSGQGMASAATADLSKGGLFVRALDPAGVGEAVAGAFVLADDDRRYQVLFRGRVSWATSAGAAYPPGPGFGVHFTKVVVRVLPSARATA